MPKDYKPRPEKKSRSSSLSAFAWMMSGLAIGLFIAFIVYLDKQPENDSNFGDAVQKELDQLKQNKQAGTGKAPAKQAQQDSDRKEQKFNFYTLLPELEVLIPESETRPPEPKDRPGTPDADKQYILQVGSFQNPADAEKLKANLAFLGLQAEVQKVRINGQNWHRVRTGPYADRKQLFRNKQLLSNNGINAISLELKQE
jgi:cell division protein FtsN